MGKGDIKSRRGKIANKSFGKRRLHKVDTKVEEVHTETKKTAKTKNAPK